MKRIFIVCTNPASDEYMAFDPDHPEVKGLGFSYSLAIAVLICRNQEHFGVEITNLALAGGAVDA